MRRKPLWAHREGGLERNDDTAVRVSESYERVLRAGETVFDEGEPGDKLYVIRSGEIELSRTGEGGMRAVARLGPGDFFGELGVVLGRPCSSRAVAICGTRVLQLDREMLEAMCRGEPEIAIRMIRVLVSRLIEAERKLASLGVDDLLRPVVRGLIRGAESDPEHGYRIPGTLRDLAEECGLSLLETHRALHRLFDNKVIRLLDDCLYASDLDAISACLEPQRAV